MKIKLISILLFVFSVGLYAQDPIKDAIKREEDVRAYTLPDVLVAHNGEAIKTKEQWEQVRRPEVLQLFKDEMYGNVPVGDRKVAIDYQLVSVDADALDGLATRKQLLIRFSKGDRSIDVPVLIYLPNSATGPVPAFMGLNFSGNHTIHADPAIRVYTGLGEKTRERGASSKQWPVERILKRGYGLMTACFHSFEPDRKDGYAEGIRSLFYPLGEKPGPTEWGAIAAWGYGMGRMLDYAEMDAGIDASRVAVFGHSRLGKAAVWTGASDARFALVISNNSGCGGAALSKRKFGESVATINHYFPYWFCDNFKKYIDNEPNIPFDQHELLALVAPRPLYVASAAEDWWADPQGEFLSAYHATPVYELYQKKGMPTDVRPPVDQPIANTLAYHIRSGKHDIKEFDWNQYLDFADRHLQASRVSYEPTWESLQRHNAAPQWFRDAKFGIYFHWGVYTVPAYGFEWYPRLMHIEKDKYFGSHIYKHHQETYGTPSEFGYHDFVPMFKAEQFDAERWADLFVKAGAKFAGPVAEHSDGFSMWPSQATPWNAMDKGPHRDVVGELEKAIRARDLKFVTTFHHACNLQRYDVVDGKKVYKNNYYEHIEGMPTTSDDPELKYLYGNMPEEQWLEEVWFPKLKEVIDGYHPDLLWFDSGLDSIPEDYRQEMAAYYLNHAGDQEVVIVRKQDDLPLDLSVNDLEKSRMNKMGDQPWMTDETISTGSWCYTTTLKIKPAQDLVHVLVDIVSKNGVLLLNVSPRQDGIIPDNQQEVLLKIGDWLSKYGEAIYGSRPWYTYGEGPTAQPEGSFENHSDFKHIKYQPEDIRYTTQPNRVYAITLGVPSPNQDILLESFAEDRLPSKAAVTQVSLLGYDGTLSYQWTEEGLHVTVPDELDEDISLVFRVDLK